MNLCHVEHTNCQVGHLKSPQIARAQIAEHVGKTLTMSHTTKDKQKLILRAKGIQGQVEGLVRVLSEERGCSEVLQVMSAARGATTRPR